MAIKKVEKIWMDGKLVPWDDAQEHVLAHTLHYGLGAFEGIRSYEQADGSAAVFRLSEHIDRLFETCHIATIEIPYSRAEIIEASLQVLRVNKLRSAYLRPLVFLGAGALGLGSLEPPVRTVIAAFEWGAYLGEEGLRRGIRCKTSAYRRAMVDSAVTKGKICGQYVTPVLAKREAIKGGYDEAIVLDGQGLVSEGTGENIFVVKNDVIRTPPLYGSLLAGITRDTVITLCRDLDLELREEPVTRDQLWVGQEVFMTGTAAEVTPIREIDDRKIGTGEPGPITRLLQEHFFAAVQGTDARHKSWLTPV